MKEQLTNQLQIELRKPESTYGVIVEFIRRQKSKNYQQLIDNSESHKENPQELLDTLRKLFHEEIQSLFIQIEGDQTKIGKVNLAGAAVKGYFDDYVSTKSDNTKNYTEITGFFEMCKNLKNSIAMILDKVDTQSVVNGYIDQGEYLNYENNTVFNNGTKGKKPTLLLQIPKTQFDEFLRKELYYGKSALPYSKILSEHYLDISTNNISLYESVDKKLQNKDPVCDQQMIQII